MSIEHDRREIQQQKELPTLSPNVRHILDVCENPAVSRDELASVLAESPTIAARLLGLANSAFFGQAGRIHSLPQAITVLGLVTVRSVAVGLVLSGIFKTTRCPNFRADRYWTSSVMTALMAYQINGSIPAALRPPADSVYLAGLLHNLGLLALVHLHPDEMNHAFAAYAAEPTKKLGDHIRDRLAFNHYQAGVWLGSKWHLPDDILLVMEYHYDGGYRGEHWPLVLLEGLCARWANRIIDGQEDIAGDVEAPTALGLPPASIERLLQQMRDKLAGVQDIARQFSNG